MKELIKITTNEQGQKLVSARELHEFLEVKSKYADWIKNRIKKYEFTELDDFITVSKILENGGREYDHAITIDMAKELSMVENNEKGKQARKYFIECEKKLSKSPLQNYLDMSEEDRAIAYFNKVKENKLLLAQVKEQEEKVNKWDKFLNTEGLITIGDFGKVIGIGRNTLFKKLREMNILQKDNVPYQRYMKYFKVKQTIKSCKTYTVTLINKNGIDYLSSKLK